MMSYKWLLRDADIDNEQLDWGTMGYVSSPAVNSAAEITAINVTMYPGKGHDFHKHPDQEELIVVRKGRLEAWLEEESAIMNPGDSMLIPRDVVHASFNVGEETAEIFVVLSPCVGESGYEVIEVADREPWKSLR